jgi:flagellar basal-body rod modification protein FlgD
MTTVNQLKGMTPHASTQASTAGENAVLGKDEFLKLFVAQLQHQDPMSPMKDQEFMGQMASFSTLEQVSKLAAANEKLAAQLSVTGSLGFIGRTVTYKGAEGVTTTGTVEKVATTKEGTVTLTVSGVHGVDPTSVTNVA